MYGIITIAALLLIIWGIVALITGKNITILGHVEGRNSIFYWITTFAVLFMGFMNIIAVVIGAFK